MAGTLTISGSSGRRNTSFGQYAPGLNAGTAGVQRCWPAPSANYETFLSDVERFASVYRELFSDPRSTPWSLCCGPMRERLR